MRNIKAFGYRTLLLFALLGALFIPFSFRSLPLQTGITKFLFENLLLGIAHTLKGLQVASSEITSDAAMLYLLVAVLFVLAVLLAATLPFFRFWRAHQSRIFAVTMLVLAGYLSLIMLRYGFDKLFKAQFYLPEPNTLYTPLGLLDKDILYWSTMGTSRSYNVFMGLLELVPAVLLLFRKTRILGAAVLAGVLLNVVVVNFSFDISVKLYSLFLLLISLLLLLPAAGALWNFFVLGLPAKLPVAESVFPPARRKGSVLLKTGVIALLLTEVLFPYFKNGAYNDDVVARPYLHGAYEVVEVRNAPERGSHGAPKRLFIHRSSYLILQYADEEMEDFHLKIDRANNQFLLTNYEGDSVSVHYEYSSITQMLVLYFAGGWTIYSKALPWQDLPLLKPLFHWSVDEI